MEIGLREMENRLNNNIELYTSQRETALE